jgi:hypothetical protein
MTERNAAGELTSEVQPGEAHATHGVIDHIRNFDHRLRAIEGKLWPDGSGPERYADGSGTERYADNWTQVSDGTGYPGSYGVGVTLSPRDSIRVIGPDGHVKNEVYVADTVGDQHVTYTANGGTVSVPRDHVVKVRPLKPFVPFKSEQPTSDWKPDPPKQA